MSFAGCCIPAVSAIIAGMAQSRLELQHFDNIGEHYALTLRTRITHLYMYVTLRLLITLASRWLA